MRLLIVLLTVLAIVTCDFHINHPFRSEPWICTHMKAKGYDSNIYDSVITHGVECFDEIMALPDILENETPIYAYKTFAAVGPYIGPTSTFRTVNIDADKLDTVDMGTILPDRESVEICLNCTVDLYSGQRFSASCSDMTTCPEKLAGAIHWNPPGNLTFSSNVEYCSYRRPDEHTNNYYCKYYHPEHALEI